VLKVGRTLCLEKELSRVQQLGGGSGGVVVKVSDLGSKGPGFDPRMVPKSECMFVNIYHY